MKQSLKNGSLGILLYQGNVRHLPEQEIVIPELAMLQLLDSKTLSL